MSLLINIQTDEVKAEIHALIAELIDKYSNEFCDACQFNEEHPLVRLDELLCNGRNRADWLEAVSSHEDYEATKREAYKQAKGGI
jgi:hypothetical protein